MTELPHLPMRSGRLVRIAGIGVHVHWTFLLLLGWIFAAHVLAGHGLATAAEGVGFVTAIFACVVLHELGHALTARRFGIQTQKITLYPIGGVASLERMPERPSQELAIAIAGPLVSFAIAGSLWLLTDRMPLPDQVPLIGGSFLGKLLYVNLSIALFNLLPAFPMDGGRVLRALLALRMPYARATQLAASAGKSIAVLLAVAGLFVNPFLVFIALFVYIAAQQEALIVQTRARLEGVQVGEAMLTAVQTVDAAKPVAETISLLLASDQDSFPVVRDAEVIGMLDRADLLAALARGQHDLPVTAVMNTGCGAVEPTDMLDAAFRRIHEARCGSLPVMQRGELVGLLTLEHVARWLTVRGALRKSPDDRPRARAGLVSWAQKALTP